jgi:hypothetical protein
MPGIMSEGSGGADHSVVPRELTSPPQCSPCGLASSAARHLAPCPERLSHGHPTPGALIAGAVFGVRELAPAFCRR